MNQSKPKSPELKRVYHIRDNDAQNGNGRQQDAYYYDDNVDAKKSHFYRRLYGIEGVTDCPEENEHVGDPPDVELQGNVGCLDHS